VRARTGLRIDGYFSAPKMQWLMRENAPIARRLRAGDALFATLDAFLIYRLTARRVFATDPTNASRTLLFDIDRLRWDEMLCALWEIPVAALPEVRGSETCFGETTMEGLLPRPVPIHGVMGDSQAALFAQQCFSPGTAKVTLGTGASLLVNVGSSRRLSQRVVTSLAWERGGACTYALEGMVNSAAASLSWLRDQMGIIANNEDAERLARDTPSAGVYLVPAFSGLGAPYWSDAARAAIVGLSAHSDRRHIARAAIEAIAFQVCDLFELLQAEAAVEVTDLCCDGGLTANSLLMQICADLMGIELRVAENPDCSARGVGLMGALGLGIYDGLQSLPKQGVAHVYRRKIAEQEAARRRNGWRRAVTQVLRTARNGTAEWGESEHEPISDHHNLRGGEPAAGARPRRM
jgi:glycerol kinase